MKQILAIFTKDARRFWPEILISLGLLAALVLTYPRQWQETGAVSSGSFGLWLSAGGAQGLLADALIILIPIAWWILIARLIHCERLVGDTQFWITRPYTWPSLLAAKLLFLAAFVYLPFFIAQSALLREAGFYPSSYLPGLLLNLFFLTVFLVLPLAALSALTTGFGRMTLAVLGVLLFIISVAATSAFLPSNTYGSIPDILSGRLAFILLFCGCAAVVLVQYARHRARLAWTLLAVVALGMCAIAAFDPDQSLMDRRFPHAAAAPVQFAYAPGGMHQPITTGTNDKHLLAIHLPMSTSGVADGQVVLPLALRATITGANGASWQSPWQSGSSEHLLPGVSAFTMRLILPDSVYDRFKSESVTLRINVALVQARRSSATVVALPRGEFPVAGFGVCKPDHWFNDFDDFSNITCRSAMGQPQLTHITAQWTDGRCGDASSQPGALGTAWAGDIDPPPADFGITSVWDAHVSIIVPRFYTSRQEVEHHNLCPGTPITFTQYREAASMQTDIAIPNFQLPELSLGDKFMMITPSS